MKYENAISDSAELTQLRKSLRQHMTPAEATLWRALKAKGVGGYRFRRQHSIGPFVLDFYCPELLLCIEVDGGIHDTPWQYEHDEQRTQYLNSKGIRVMRVRNEQVWSNMQHIADRILAYAQGSERAMNIRV